MDWYKIGYGSARICMRFASDWHKIYVRLTMDRHRIDNGLVLDWQGISTALTMDRIRASAVSCE